ncbi:MAG: GNAT family N-acetyltransferase [Desulfomonilia bacterium]
MSDHREMVFSGIGVYLRGLEENDLTLRPKWFNDPEINRTLLMDYPISLATTMAWFRRAAQEQHHSRIDLSICDTATDRVIGMTGLLRIDRRHLHAQFYMTIGEKDYWGRHIPDEVIPMVLRYAFGNLNLNKIYLWTIPANTHARRVYERNGFVQEACMAQHFYCRGALQDIYQHRILKEEWLKDAPRKKTSEGGD